MPKKFVPVTTTTVPTGPWVGVKDAMLGNGLKLAPEVAVPAGVVT